MFLNHSDCSLTLAEPDQGVAGFGFCSAKYVAETSCQWRKICSAGRLKQLGDELEREYLDVLLSFGKAMGKGGHVVVSHGLCFYEIVCGHYCLWSFLDLVFSGFIRDASDTKFFCELSDIFVS